MLARAKSRLAADGCSGPRVRFEHADVFSANFDPAHYDAVVTLFFLDCFSPERVAALRDRIQESLKPGAYWLFTDFAVPTRGWRRWRARVWLAILYAFFRWQTSLSARSLPDSGRLLAEAGWRPEALREFRGGLIRTVLFQRHAVPTARSNPADSRT
jgi:cyclopropane fatty-acyl-phospholipid synthase-like methyltransferase